MSMSMGGGSSVKAEPNVTPMIDVMLVLLIIFMVVVPMLNAGFRAIPPEAINLKAHPEDPDDQVLGIDADGKYYLNKKPIAFENLADQLQTIFAARTTDKILYVKADKELEYGKVLDAIDVAAHNGVRVVGAITEQTPNTKSTLREDPETKSATPGATPAAAPDATPAAAPAAPPPTTP